MTTLRAALVAVALAVLAAGAAEAGGARLRDGAYQVEVSLDLPHVANTGARKTATVCVSARGRADYGLVVLSDNNPLAACPATNVRQDGDRLTFDIVRAGANAARATATYTLGAERFRGRIAMKMGGKNMTMTETQHGRRVGDCDPADRPRQATSIR